MENIISYQERNNQLDQLKDFWFKHGKYNSTIAACKDARNNGFNELTLAGMVNLYRNLFKIDNEIIDYD
jgi:hypothetical protein